MPSISHTKPKKKRKKKERGSIKAACIPSISSKHRNGSGEDVIKQQKL